jgi:hypothetical protein
MRRTREGIGGMTVCVMCGCEVECAIGDVCEACLHDMNDESEG